jgi:hypothetical protein
MVDVVRTVQDTRQSLHNKYHRAPTLEEISEASGLDTGGPCRPQAPAETVSLDRPVGEDGDASLQSFVGCDAVTPGQGAAAWRRTASSRRWILDPEEQQSCGCASGWRGLDPVRVGR